jgi:hemolysin-activating ACP:hemolysin acyltransferase
MSKYVVDSLYLFNKSPVHRDYTVADFSRFVLLPLLHSKLRVFYEGEQPVSLVTWCWLTNQESEDFLNDAYAPDEEAFRRDRSDKLWGMDFIAPFGHTILTMRRMRQISSDLYGPQTAVHWIRHKEPQKMHKRTF